MSHYAGIKPQAFTRGEYVDGELDWPDGLTVGKMAMVWANSQHMGLCEVKGAMILKWAKISDKAEGERFLELVSSDQVEFLTELDDGRYFIEGNPKRIDSIEKQRQKSAKGGKAKARRRRESDPEDPKPNDSIQPQAVPEAEPEVVPEAEPQAVPEALPQVCPRTRTRNTYTGTKHESPPDPQVGGGGRSKIGPPGLPTKREMRALAKGAAVDVCKAIFDGAHPADAQACLSPFAWRLVQLVHGGWDRAFALAERSTKKGEENIFAYRLRDDFTAKAQQAWLDTGGATDPPARDPPDPGERYEWDDHATENAHD